MPPKKQKSSSPDYPSLGKSIVKASGNDAACKLKAGLYIVATPIGHLGDITLRGLATLANADAIACEDTRTSGVLLAAFGIKKPTFSYHDHNADAKRPEILDRIAAGEAIALISDAGMPVIADPGFKLVRDCRDMGYAVTVIPGANAALVAMAGSGLPTDQFYFAGFLPPKSAARQKEIGALRHTAATLIFYEAPQRLAACLADMVEMMGADRPAVVARELTKLFEETRRGTLGELAAHYAANEVKGEIVILIGRGAQKEIVLDIDALLAERLQHTTLRDAVAEVAEMSGRKKTEVYSRALMLAPKRK
ncbi:MAG: 16S rRNA (cytidine(1402)-2'-O)-methyltransferase [Alphaproteobacteria bacterium]|nr:16S rRNA (cytidine(1402)-2'-O)-methyltransferase [Alphaproteobacteria bacterium]